MRIAISADSKQGLDSVVGPHFGRCPYFVLVDLEGSEVRGVRDLDNPYYYRHDPGQVPAFIASLGANVMLTGGMGGRAILFFEQFGIEGVTGAYGTVRQSVERYLGGQLRGAAPCHESGEHGHGDLPALSVQWCLLPSGGREPIPAPVRESTVRRCALAGRKLEVRFPYRPIGFIRSPFHSIEKMPIQPAGAAGIRGEVELLAEFAPGLQDLDGFSHIILLYHFHRVTGSKLIVVPFLDSVPRGVFATRAPCRPE